MVIPLQYHKAQNWKIFYGYITATCYKSCWITYFMRFNITIHLSRLSRSIFRWCLRLEFFSIIWVLHLIFVLILRCSSWLNVPDIFIFIPLRCFHSLWSSILTDFIILLWMLLDVLFNIAWHLRCNCLLLVYFTVVVGEIV